MMETSPKKKKKIYGYQITSRKILKPLIIREIQIKVPMVFHYTLFRMPIFFSNHNIKVLESQFGRFL